MSIILYKKRNENKNNNNRCTCSFGNVKTGDFQHGVINYIPIHAKTPKIGTSFYSKVPTHTTFIIIKNSYSNIEISHNIIII